MAEIETSQSDPNDDIWGGIEHLKYALEQPELQAFSSAGEMTPAVRRAAYWVAVARGECRLSGATPPPEMGTLLSIPMAVAAAKELKEFLHAWTGETSSLDDRFDHCDPLEGEDITTSFVERRLEAWAALVAIDDAYVSAIETQADSQDSLAEALDDVLGSLCDFDDALQRQALLLSVAADTNLLENWRRMLVPEFRNGLPWVLDGTLETISRKSWESVLSKLEKPELWEKAIRYAAQSGSGALAVQPERVAETFAERVAQGAEVLEEACRRLTEAFRRQFRPEVMLAIAAESETKQERKVLWDSKQDLAPERYVVYLERNGDLSLHVSSTDDSRENQTFEVVVQEQTRPTFTFRRDSKTGQLFGTARIRRDELPHGGALSRLTFRLKKL